MARIGPCPIDDPNCEDEPNPPSYCDLPENRDKEECQVTIGPWNPIPFKPVKDAIGGGGPGGEGAPPPIPRVPYNAPPVDFSKFLSRTPMEAGALQAISELARLISGWGSGLYGVGMPAYEAAINYYRALLGGSKGAATRAIGPQAEMVSEVYKGAQRDIENMPRGGGRDQALAELARSRAGQIGSLIPLAQQAGVSGALQGGLAGAQAGIGAAGTSASLQGGIVEAEQTNRLAGLSAFLQNKALDLQRLLGLRGQDIQEMLGLKNIELGYAGIDAQMAALSQANSQFQQSFGLQNQYFDWYRQFQQQQLQAQQRASQGSKWGSLLGTAIQGGTTIATKGKMVILALTLNGFLGHG